MTPAVFLATRKASWARLEELIAGTGLKGAAGLNDEELHELTRLYQTAAVDVARARMYKLDSQTQERVNRLAISAHGLLYRRPHRRPLRSIRRFFSSEYPRLFRSLWIYVLVAAAIFTAGALGSYISVRTLPSNAYIFVPMGLDISGGPEVSAEDVSERYRKMPKPPMASAITTNNLSVAFGAFALGISAGIGTCYLILLNAMMLGGFVGHFVNHGLAYECFSFITPHGALEIFAILVSAAAGLRMGFSIAVPGHLKRKTALIAGAREAVQLVLGTIPMFITAGLIESFITPTNLPGGMKITLGLTVLTAALIYLLGTGHRGITPLKKTIK